MKSIQHPLDIRDHGEAVANVEDALLFSARKAASSIVCWQTRRSLGWLVRTETARAVKAFRKQFGLKLGEIIETRTVDALNGPLREIEASQTPTLAVRRDRCSSMRPRPAPTWSVSGAAGGENHAGARDGRYRAWQQRLELAPRSMLQYSMEYTIVMAHGVDPLSRPERRQIALNADESTLCTLSTRTKPDSRGRTGGVNEQRHGENRRYGG
jgi:hypothetical protein